MTGVPIHHNPPSKVLLKEQKSNFVPKCASPFYRRQSSQSTLQGKQNSDYYATLASRKSSRTRPGSASAKTLTRCSSTTSSVKRQKMKDRIDEDSKKLYGIKAVSRDTKHLGIMVEAANIAEISKEKG